MKKLKKVLVSFVTLGSGLASKAYAALDLMGIEPKYGIVETKYGIFEPTIGEKISRVGKFAIPIILFVIVK